MSKTALLFPGQASQYVGMGKDLHAHSAAVRALYELASTELDADIAKLSFEGPAEELKRTRYTQPAILVHALSVCTILGENLPDFDFSAGHSLGEYAALAVSGAFSYEDAIRAVAKRASLMEEACEKNPGSMAAIIGLDEAGVRTACEKAAAKGIVVAANLNSQNQIVISGEISALEEAMALAKQSGAKRALMLEVGGAFHSPLMEPAKVGMQKYLAGMNITDTATPVIANVTAGPVQNKDEIASLLARQITAPVRWSDTMKYMNEAGVTTVIEIGPGKVLTGMAKREMNAERLINIDTLADIESFAVALSERG